jgi:hypothetical protein
MNLNDLDDESKQRLFSIFFDTYITPEVLRRHDAGRLQIPVDLHAAQIVFYPDGRPPLVRLDAEVKAIGTTKLRDGVARASGEAVYEDDIDEIVGIELSDEDDPDCGHATLMRIKGRWILGFDFRYNKALARRHVETASHFYDAATFAVDRGYLEVAIDNLFSAAELLARASLLSFSGPEFRQKTTHKDIQIKYNRFASLGNVQPDHQSTFNRLSGLRTSARYLKGEVDIDQNEVGTLMVTVKDMIGRAAGSAAE